MGQFMVFATWNPRDGSFTPVDEITWSRRDAAEQDAERVRRLHPAWTVEVREVHS